MLLHRKLAPEIIAGDKCIIDKNSDKAITFKSNAAFLQIFRKNGSNLMARACKRQGLYGKAGSIIVTLNPRFNKKSYRRESML